MACKNVNLQEWNGFGFKLIAKSDHPKVLDHLRNNYYKDEPFNKALGLTPERIADLDELIPDCICDGSFLAYPMDDVSKIAAVILLHIQEKKENSTPFKPRSPLTPIEHEAGHKLHYRYDIFEKQQAKTYPEIYIISTDKECRGKGLATEMFKRAIDKLRCEGHKFVATCFTSPEARKIGERFGFKQVSRVDFDECKKPDGSPAFGEAGIGQFAINSILHF